MVLRLIADRKTKWRLRFLAVLNLIGSLYFLVMCACAAYLVWFEILPYFYDDGKLMMRVHKTFVVYVSVNALGNFVCCLLADNGVRRCESEKKKKNEWRWKDRPTKVNSCEHCQAWKPNRSHHCPLCATCILRRDHHCFFMTVCIGYFNQKHFIFYCLFMFAGTFYTLIMVVKYAHAEYGVQFSGPQTFVTLLIDFVADAMSGRPPSVFHVFIIYMLYSCLVMGLAAVAFLYWQVAIATSGQTSYEAWRGLETYSQDSVKENWKDVFGKYWPLLVLLPLPLPQYSDGTYNSESNTRKKKS